LEEDKPIEAVLDIAGPFETDEFSAYAALRYHQSRYTRCQSQPTISHGSICHIALQYPLLARQNVSPFTHVTKGGRYPETTKAGEIRRPCGYYKLSGLFGRFDLARR
jgi:hypothetical protein